MKIDLMLKSSRNALGFMIEKTATITTSARKIHNGLADDSSRAPFARRATPRARTPSGRGERRRALRRLARCGLASGSRLTALRPACSAPVIAPTSDSSVASLRAERRHPAPEAQHLDPVGDLEHVGHVVADQHDRHAAVAHAPDHVQHVLGLDHAECGRRLVHDDHLARPRRPPAQPQRPDAGRRRGRRPAASASLTATPRSANVSTAARASRACRARRARPSRPGSQQLATHVDVGGAVEVGRQRQVLVDGLDPELLSGRRTSRSRPIVPRTAARRCRDGRRPR